MEKNRSFGVVIVAGLIGAVLGLLFAPKSGKETRDDLRKKALEAREKASDTSDVVKKVVKEGSDELKSGLKRSAKEMSELGEEAKIRASRIAEDARATSARVEQNARKNLKSED